MTKTISLSEDAYRLLKKQKRGEESFSDTVRRLAASRSSLVDLLGLYPELVGNSEFADQARAARQEIEARLG